MALDWGYPNSPADQRGWGPGYPNCQPDKWVPLAAKNGVGFGQVHRRVHDLLFRLLNECILKGYPPKDGQCWGAVCRCSHDSSGNCVRDATGHEVPSNHSWGLAIDFNSLDNVYGATTYKMPQWVPNLFHDYGFRWLGPPIHDWQHLDFCGTPEDADRMLRKARRNGLGESQLSYKVGTKTFRLLRNAIDYLRDRLKNSKAGKRLRVRVVKR